ncbi:MULTISPECIES: hypothetical protein [unclassified Massilia]|nr:MULTISPECIES: hypothetical protein [unclassified Massilia]
MNRNINRNNARSKAVIVAKWVLLALMVLFLVTRVIRYFLQ